MQNNRFHESTFFTSFRYVFDTIKLELAAEVRRQLPHMDSDEAKQLTQNILTTAKSAEEAVSRNSFARFAGLQAHVV